MALTKTDLRQIKKVVDVSATKTRQELRKEIQAVKKELRGEIQESKNEVIAILSREVTDLAEINRIVIERVDRIADLEKEIAIIKTKIGLDNF